MENPIIRIAAKFQYKIPSLRTLAVMDTIGSLSSDVFERRTSTGNGRFALLSRDFEQIFGQIVSVRIKTLGNINTVVSRLIKRGKGSLPVDVRRSKTSLLKLPNLMVSRSSMEGNTGQKWIVP